MNATVARRILAKHQQEHERDWRCEHERQRESDALHENFASDTSSQKAQNRREDMNDARHVERFAAEEQISLTTTKLFI